MKKLLALLFAFVVFFATTNLFAAEPQTKQDSKALFFGLNGLSNLGVDDGYLGLQYLFQDNMGVWGSLGFNTKTYKPYENADEDSYTNLEFGVGLIYYAFQKGPVAAWVSPELGIGIGSADTKSTKITDNSFWAGVSLGAEWWAFDGVSLSASVFLGYENLTTTTEAKSVPNSEIKSKENKFGILPGQGKFQILFYF